MAFFTVAHPHNMDIEQPFPHILPHLLVVNKYYAYLNEDDYLIKLFYIIVALVFYDSYLSRQRKTPVHTSQHYTLLKRKVIAKHQEKMCFKSPTNPSGSKPGHFEPRSLHSPIKHHFFYSSICINSLL